MIRELFPKKSGIIFLPYWPFNHIMGRRDSRYTRLLIEIFRKERGSYFCFQEYPDGLLSQEIETRSLQNYKYPAFDLRLGFVTILCSAMFNVVSSGS